MLGSALIELFPPRAGLSLNDVAALSIDASGSATIVSAVAAGLGASVNLISAVGDDALGDVWKSRISAAGVNVGQVGKIAGQLTPVAVSTVDLAGRKTYAFYRFSGWCDPLALMRLTCEQRASALSSDVLIVTEAAIRGEILRKDALALMRQRTAEGRLTVFAVNYRESAWSSAEDAASAIAHISRVADVVCCNHAEYELLSQVGVAADLIYETLGADGVRVHRTGQSEVVPAAIPPGGVALDTGAGDTFCGSVGVALAEGRSAVDAARFATAVCALAISREAAISSGPSRADVDEFVQSAAVQGGWSAAI